MLYIKSFKNYDEFKNIFAVVEHGNGVKSRKNKILLSWLKDRQFLKAWLALREKLLKYDKEVMDNLSYLNARNVDDMKKSLKWVLERGKYLNDPLVHGYCYYNAFNSIDWRMFHTTLHLDDNNGLCDDGDTKSIRYYNEENGRVFKMKAGKFITSCIESLSFSRSLPEQVKRWAGEEFARDWQVYAEKEIGDRNNLTLFYGSEREDFERIYDQNCLVGDFCSCMVNTGQSDFYYDAVDATAAWLENTDGDIVARCVIFNDVKDEEEKLWRLAERQYSTDQNDTLKQILVSKLIDEGLIDGYKRVGAGCHNHRDFIANNGESLRDKVFYINCSLEDGDTLSYQDSFAYYNIDEHEACNSDDYDYTDSLDKTDLYFESGHYGRNYSEYSEEWIDEEDSVYDRYNEDWIYSVDAVTAYYRGQEISIHRNRIDYFVWSNYEEMYIYEDEAIWLERNDDYCIDEHAVKDINGDYILEDDAKWSSVLLGAIHEDDAVWSRDCKDWLYEPDAFYSKLLDDYFFDEESMEDAEELYRKEHALMCVSA